MSEFINEPISVEEAEGIILATEEAERLAEEQARMAAEEADKAEADKIQYQELLEKNGGDHEAAVLNIASSIISHIAAIS